jgi:hypothetical protein
MKREIFSCFRRGLKLPVVCCLSLLAAAGGAQTPMANVFDNFDRNTNSHNFVNAYLLATLSYFVYGATPGQTWAAFRNEFENRFKPWGVEHVEPIRNTPNGTECVVVTTKDAVIVVFRGTETKFFRNRPALHQEDWVTDAIFVMTGVPSWGSNVRVHTGFYNAMTSVYQDVRNEVRKRATDGRTVWLTGHSLGAALATLTAYRLEKLGGVSVKGVYTFGSPRVGNAYFADEYNKILRSRTHRWAHAGDGITLLPAAGANALTGYRHVGLTHNINANATRTLNTHELSAPPNVPILGNHNIIRYMWQMHQGISSAMKQKVHAPVAFGIGLP